MPDLNEEIRKLKEEGLSLRKIAATLNMSHEAVRKRLKAVNDKNQVSTNPEYQKLTASTIENGKVSTAPNAHQSRTSEKVMDTVNQVSTQKTPSLPLNESVNPSGTPSHKPPECKKEVFQGVLLDIDDLLEAIKEFLELNGVEVYRMKVEQEAYQVKHKGQVIRIYVQRKMESPKPPGRVSGG